MRCDRANIILKPAPKPRAKKEPKEPLTPKKRKVQDVKEEENEAVIAEEDGEA